MIKDSHFHQLVTVAVDFPKSNSLLTYTFNKEKFIDDQLCVGDYVDVPLGRRVARGIIVDFPEQYTGKFTLKEVKAKIATSAMREKDLHLYQWMAKYYHYSLGKLIFDCLPSVKKSALKDPSIMGQGENFPFNLNDKLQNIVDKITLKAIEPSSGSQFSQWLIHGVTGSGKSLIFYHLIQKVISTKRSALMLVPEINLTPQFIDYYSKFLSCKIYAYHSQIGPAKKMKTWNDLSHLEQPCLVIGARSSLFLPIENLGAIFIDEEHDSSYKQEDRCHFHARDVAVKKAQLYNIPVVMASATPSVETYARFQSQNLQEHYCTIKERYSQSVLPKVIIEKLPTKFGEIFTEKDLAQMKSHFGKSKIMIFLNKLGYSNYLVCSGCGHKFECPNCSVSLTYFKNRNQLECHLCSYSDKKPQSCPSCSCIDIFPVGYGTEQIMETLKGHFPDKKIIRFDRDEVRTVKQLQNQLSVIYQGDFDILIGTQMIAKGHNIKDLNLIYVLGADAMLSIPDFRSLERTYQMLTQVLGRAGRFSDKSQVIIKSNRTEHLYDIIKKHSFDDFYQQECSWRKDFFYPPYSRCAVVHVVGKSEGVVKQVIIKIKQKVDHLSKTLKSLLTKGPAPNLIYRHTNQYRYHFIIFSEDVNSLHHVVHNISEDKTILSSVTVRVDVDPLSF